MITSTEQAIEINALTRRYGQKKCLDDVSLRIPRGCVFSLIGANGAGKTTFLRHVMGQLRAQHGSVQVFGLHPIRQCTAMLERVGYLSEENDLPGWMRVEELMRYLQAFYRKWDTHLASRTIKDFDLQPSARISTLSKGQRARVGLVAAIAHHPDLLVLDEPSSGLDPLVRRDILNAIIRLMASEGRTVLFSSHLLDEVERVTDHVAILRQGKIIVAGPIEDVRRSHQMATVQFPTACDRPPEIPGMICWNGSGREWTGLAIIPLERIEHELLPLGGVVVESRSPQLEEIFLARAGAEEAGAVR